MGNLVPNIQPYIQWQVKAIETQWSQKSPDLSLNWALLLPYPTHVICRFWGVLLPLLEYSKMSYHQIHWVPQYQPYTHIPNSRSTFIGHIIAKRAHIHPKTGPYLTEDPLAPLEGCLM